MKLTLTVIAGPHAGREFGFDGRDSFLVGRGSDAHLQLSAADPYFSRRHFVIELNPPRCRLLDLNSRNGVLVNGRKVTSCELVDGDEVSAGSTVFRVSARLPGPDDVRTLDLPPTAELTGAYVPPAGDQPITGYTLGEELGRGGMGVVYRATRVADGLAAAVKVITPAAGASEKAVQRFLREARILGQLKHPHVVQFLEAGEAGDQLFIAMELVDGTDCAKMVSERGPLPVPLAVRMICQALDGLAHAHAAGFVHRDVKPHNLLIGGAKGARTLKVADFGLARVYEASRLSGLTLNGEMGGTPAFMAPEQVTHYRDVKPTADQYSAAASLYYLLTGTYVFDFPNDTAGRLVTILTGAQVPITTRRSDVPSGLSDVIHRALAREPESRFADLAALRSALVPYSR